MSIVSLTDDGEDNTKKEDRIYIRTGALSLREENDSRRIRQTAEAAKHPNGRPRTAPFQLSNAGPGNPESLNILGTKQAALEKEIKKELMSKSTVALPTVLNTTTSPLRIRPASSLSPARSRAESPISKFNAKCDTRDVDIVRGSATLERRKEIISSLSERDQTSLKLGRLVLNTVMGNPDLSTEDSISRFFFDNWLAKSGSNSQQADSYSIELMSHLQAQIAEAHAEASVLLDNVNMQRRTQADEGDGDGDAEYEGEVNAEVHKSVSWQGQSEMELSREVKGMFSALPRDMVKGLGEKIVHKAVGSVALEALDRCILEFGKGNPILNDVRAALIPLLFADTDDMPALLSPPTTDTSSELSGQKYIKFQTWLEDAQLMFDNCRRKEKELKKAELKAHVQEFEVKNLNAALKKEQARVEPLIAEHIALRAARDEQVLLKEQLEESLKLVQADIYEEITARKGAEKETAAANQLIVSKNNLISQLQSTIDQMERDKLPDIRGEYANALKQIQLLTEEQHDLNTAIDNFKIMLRSQQERDTQSELFLKDEAEKVRVKMKYLNGELEDGPEGVGRVFGENRESTEDIESERHLTEPLEAFFMETNRALNGERYEEYLELQHRVTMKEITNQREVTKELRRELFDAKAAVQRVIDAYELKIQVIHKNHAEEIINLKAEHEAEMVSLRELTERLQETIAIHLAEISSLKLEVDRLNEEWTATRAELQITREQLENALIQIEKAKEQILSLEGQIETLNRQLKATEEELADTRDELADTKKALNETIAELRESEDQLKFSHEIISTRTNELGMTVHDGLLDSKLTKEKAQSARLKAQLDFAKVEVSNLKDSIKRLEHEIKDLHAEINSLNAQREHLEQTIAHLKTTISKMTEVAQTKQERIIFLEQALEHECMIAADRYHRAEQTVDHQKAAIQKLEDEISQLIQERNDVIRQRESVKVELKAMESRAIEAEHCTIGNQNLRKWMEDELTKCIATITKPKDPNAFEEEFGVSPLVLKKSLDSLSKETFIDKVPDSLKKDSIDLITRADAQMRALADTFTVTIKNLQQALEVSREIIKDTQTIRDEVALASNQASSAANMTGISSVTITNHANLIPSGDMAAAETANSNSTLQIVPSGWAMYNAATDQLVPIEVISRIKENMNMILQDDRDTHDKRQILHLVMAIHNYGASDSNDKETSMINSDTATSGTKDSNSNRPLDDEHTKRILRKAAVAVETENPLRDRVEKQHKEILQLENALADLKVDVSELESELNGSKRDFERANKAKEAAEVETVVMRERFEQAMKAVREQEREVIRIKKEAEEGIKLKQETAHPAIKMQMMAEAARGNPKKLVQPFLHFMRRNENEISRHLGQQIVAMRETRALCDRVKHSLEGLLQEEKMHYYKKHNNEKDTTDILATMNKMWGAIRASRDDLHEYTSWVFEGQDFSLGNDYIRKAMKLDSTAPFFDPSKAIGDNHLAAAYSLHAKTALKGGTEEFHIDDEIKDDVHENAEAVAENLQCESFRSGGWRMQLYRLDGSVDLDMAVTDWPVDDKILILNAQLQAAKQKITEERTLGADRLDKLKAEKAKSDSRVDDIQDQILDLQKEYGAKGIEHDFLIYKRIKKGIIDGSLQKYNLPEIVYSPTDFEDIEIGIYEAVQTLVDLCRSDGQLDRPPNPFPTKDIAISEPYITQEGTGALAGTLGSRLSSPTAKPRARPSAKVHVDDLTANEIGASGMELSNMALGPVERVSSRQGPRNKATVPVSIIARPGTSTRAATAAPPSEWRDHLDSRKRKQALAKHKSDTQPSQSGAYLTEQEQNRITKASLNPAQTQASNEEKSEPPVVNDGMPLFWNNKKSQDLVNLLNSAVEKIKMRILYAKVIKPKTPSHARLDTGMDFSRGSLISPSAAIPHSVPSETLQNSQPNTASEILSNMDGLHKTEALPPDACYVPAESINVNAMSQEDLHELFQALDETADLQGEGELSFIEAESDKEGLFSGSMHLPETAPSEFAKELFSNGAELLPEESARLSSNNDISRFVSKLNAKVNKHITSAKLYESIAAELEATRENTGALDMATVKRIFALRTALPVGEAGEADMATMLSQLKLSKPPRALARSSHLVRDDHHHLVQEEKLARQFVNGAWGGRPHFLNELPQHNSRLPALQATAAVNLADQGTVGARSLNQGSLSSAAPLGIDPRFPSPSNFVMSTVALAASGSASNYNAKEQYAKKNKAPVLNIALLPVSQPKPAAQDRFQNFQQTSVSASNMHMMLRNANQTSESIDQFLFG